MIFLRNLSVGMRLSLAFGAVVAIFCTVVLIVWFTGVRMAEAERRNLHSHKVIAAGDEMLEHMLNMETGARGFLISGEDSHLAAWEAGRRGFESAWAEARRMAADDADKQRRLDAL